MESAVTLESMLTLPSSLPWTSHCQGRLPPFVTVVRCPGKSDSLEKGFLLAHGCSRYSPSGQKSGQQELDGTACLQSKEQWCMRAGARLDFSAYTAQAPPTIKMGLPISINILN